MRTTSEVVCFGCGKKFLKPDSEIKRSKTDRHFCGLKCTGSIVTDNLPPPLPKGVLPPQLRPNNRLDEFSPFRYVFRTARRRAKELKREFTVSLRDLKDRWEKQKGVCPYTGWDLLLPESTHKTLSTKKIPRRASLDRIKSSEGYVPGNIQFVAMIANYAKNEWEDTHLLEFAHAVADNNKWRDDVGRI